MSVVLRDALAEDAEAIARGEHRTAATPGLLNALPGEIPVASFRDKITALAGHDRGLYLVAEESGEVIGHLLLDPLPLAQNAHVCSLTIVVYPGHTDQGAGRMLLNEAIVRARRNPQVEKIELRVRAGNERAIHLYESVGFQREGVSRRRVKQPDGHYLDDLLMGLFVEGEEET